ncbi:UbiA family prenyltransferase [Aquihabitans sp. G128]|nr:UbiA family prenyltransferase [Aquihabitans sp. G128]
MKNLLLFAVLGAAGVIDHLEAASSDDALGVLARFCLAAAGTYYLNDAVDVEADRLHPTKRFRPIAAGEIPLPLARALGAAGILGSVASGLRRQRHLAVVVAAYVITTTARGIWAIEAPGRARRGGRGGRLRPAGGGRRRWGGRRAHLQLAPLPVASFVAGSWWSVGCRAESTSWAPKPPPRGPRSACNSRDFAIQLQTISSSVVMVGYRLWCSRRLPSPRPPCRGSSCSSCPSPSPCCATRSSTPATAARPEEGRAG